MSYLRKGFGIGWYVVTKYICFMKSFILHRYTGGSTVFLVKVSLEGERRPARFSHAFNAKVCHDEVQSCYGNKPIYPQVSPALPALVWSPTPEVISETDRGNERSVWGPPSDHVTLPCSHGGDGRCGTPGCSGDSAAPNWGQHLLSVHREPRLLSSVGILYIAC